MNDKLETRLSAHFRAELNRQPSMKLALPPREGPLAGWRVALVAGLAAAMTLGGLSQRSGPIPSDEPLTAVAEMPLFLPISSQFIATGDEFGLVYLDDAPMQLIRNTGIHRTEYATADGQTRLSIAVRAHDVFLTNCRVD